MVRFLSVLGLVCVSIACGPMAPVARLQPGAAGGNTIQPDPKFYELYRPGDPITDQATGAPGSHSSLVGTSEAEDSDVRDDDFAANVAVPALRAGAGLYLSLGQCFSGGFFDELAPLHGTQSILTSARHSETASYGEEPPGGVDVDYTDAFIRALADGRVPAEQVAAETTALNPFGPNPAAARIGEQEGSEHAQYLALGDGANLRPAEHAQSGMAVLWAGMPAERDGVQMNLMIDHLVSMGFDRDHIWLLYGGGQADAAHPIVKSHILGQIKPIHLLAATRKQLFGLFSSTFASKQGPLPSFVFLYVGDHGGLNAVKEAKLHFGLPDRLITNAPPSPMYGEGDRHFQ